MFIIFSCCQETTCGCQNMPKWLVKEINSNGTKVGNLHPGWRTSGLWGGRKVEPRDERCGGGAPVFPRSLSDGCLIWMQLIREVDWFDSTGGAGQQSALVCEGVHARVDIYAFRGSFNNGIKGSVSERASAVFPFVPGLSHSHIITNPFSNVLLFTRIKAERVCVTVEALRFTSGGWVR